MVNSMLPISQPIPPLSMFSVAAHVNVRVHVFHLQKKHFAAEFSPVDFVTSENAFPDPNADFYFNGMNISLKA